MQLVADVLDVSRSNLQGRLNWSVEPRRNYPKALDASVLLRIEQLVAERPTYG